MSFQVAEGKYTGNGVSSRLIPTGLAGSILVAFIAERTSGGPWFLKVASAPANQHATDASTAATGISFSGPDFVVNDSAPDAIEGANDPGREYLWFALGV